MAVGQEENPNSKSSQTEAPGQSNLTKGTPAKGLEGPEPISMPLASGPADSLPPRPDTDEPGRFCAAPGRNSFPGVLSPTDASAFLRPCRGPAKCYGSEPLCRKQCTAAGYNGTCITVIKPSAAYRYLTHFTCLDGLLRFCFPFFPCLQ